MICDGSGFRACLIFLVFTCPVFSGFRTLASDEDSLAPQKIVAQLGKDTLEVIQLNKLAFDNFANDVNALREYSTQALVLARKLKYKRGEATAYKNLALSAMMVHGDVSALKYLQASFSMFSWLKDTINIASVTNYTGCYYATIKDFKNALPYLLKAEKLLGNRQDILRFTILSNIGACYSDLGEYDKAKEYFLRVKKLAVAAKDYDWIVTTIQNLAGIHLKRNELVEALALSDSAFTIVRTHSISLREQQSIYLLRGDIAYKFKEYERSRKYYQDSEIFAKRMKSREYMADIYYKYHQLDSIAGNYEGSLLNFKLYKQINDSLLNVNKNDLTALYRVKFAVKEQEDENSRLVAARNNDEKIIFYQRLILAFAFLAVAGFGFAFFRTRRLNAELRDLNTRIARQNMELEEVNGIKNKIFSVIAHDLRNPFAQFMSILDMFKNHMVENGDIDALLPFLNKSVRQTMDMMERLLIWSKSQLNGFKVNPENINIDSLVADTVEKLQGPIEEKKLTVQIEKVGRHTAWGDLEMIRIVVRNLLANAIKFTPVNGVIDLETSLDDQHLTLAFHDTGVGIGPEQLTKLFSFDAKSTRGTENESGTGLGLKICNDLLTLNKGQIRVESVPGAGSTFYVRLPLKG